MNKKGEPPVKQCLHCLCYMHAACRTCYACGAPCPSIAEREAQFKAEHEPIEQGYKDHTS